MRLLKLKKRGETKVFVVRKSGIVIYPEPSTEKLEQGEEEIVGIFISIMFNILEELGGKNYEEKRYKVRINF